MGVWIRFYDGTDGRGNERNEKERKEEKSSSFAPIYSLDSVI
jgi:hypothetical protein